MYLGKPATRFGLLHQSIKSHQHFLQPLDFKPNAMDEEVEGGFVGDSSDELDEIDWNWLDVEFMKDDTGKNIASAVDGPFGHHAKQDKCNSKKRS
jgi:hypothetical protein